MFCKFDKGKQFFLWLLTSCLLPGQQNSSLKGLPLKGKNLASFDPLTLWTSICLILLYFFQGLLSPLVSFPVFILLLLLHTASSNASNCHRGQFWWSMVFFCDISFKSRPHFVRTRAQGSKLSLIVSLCRDGGKTWRFTYINIYL